MKVPNRFKYYLLSTVCYTLLACHTNDPEDHKNTFAEAKDTMSLSPSSSKPTAYKLSNVNNIQHAYQSIMADYHSGKLDSNVFKYNCDGERSGTVSYFSQAGVLKMIVHVYAEYDHDEMKDSYFIQEEKPFFIHLTSLSWSFDNGPEGATKDQITEKRMYLLDWKPLKCLRKQYEIRKHAGVNPKPEDVPNKVVDCSQSESTKPSFQRLFAYWRTEAPDCLAK